MRFLDRVKLRRLKRKAEKKKDQIYKYYQRKWFEKYGYYFDWDLGAEYADNYFLQEIYKEMNDFLPKEVVDNSSPRQN